MRTTEDSGEFVKISLTRWEQLNKELRRLKEVLGPKSEIVFTRFGWDGNTQYFNLTAMEFKADLLSENERLRDLVAQLQKATSIQKVDESWKQKNLWARVFKK